jgi:hypothetical protein
MELVSPDHQHWIFGGPILTHLIVVVGLLSIDDANRRIRREDEQEWKEQEGRILPGKWDSRQKMSIKNDRRINFFLITVPHLSFYSLVNSSPYC